MRIAYITIRFPDRTERFACTDVRMLRESGAEVVVHSLRLDTFDTRALLGECGIDTIETSFNSVSASLMGLLYALRWPRLTIETTLWLVRHAWRRPRDLAKSLVLLPRSLDILASLRRRPPDVVHLFWGHYPSIVGRLVQRTMPDVVVSMFLGAYDLVYGYGPSAPVARGADVIWTHAKHNVAAIAQLGLPPERIAVAYRGLDLAAFPPPADRKIGCRVVSASRLIHEKHMDDVLVAFGRAREVWPEATLTIMGEGPDRPRLARLARSLGIANAVSFPGHLSHARVRAEMAKAEVFAFMSRDPTDRLTNAIKEAMASGCVCVVSRTAGLDELVVDGVTGYVIEPGDVDGVASRIDLAFRDSARARRIAKAAGEHVRAHFDARKTMTVYRERWSELVRQRANRRLQDLGARDTARLVFDFRR